MWTVPKSPLGEPLRNGGLTPLRSAEPSPALRKRSLSHGAEVRNITSYCQKSPLLSCSSSSTLLSKSVRNLSLWCLRCGPEPLQGNLGDTETEILPTYNVESVPDLFGWIVMKEIILHLLILLVLPRSKVAGACSKV